MVWLVVRRIGLKHLKRLGIDINEVDQAWQECANLSHIVDDQRTLEKAFDAASERVERGGQMSAGLTKGVDCVERLEDLLEFNEVLRPIDGRDKIGCFALACEEFEASSSAEN